MIRWTYFLIGVQLKKWHNKPSQGLASCGPCTGNFNSPPHSALPFCLSHPNNVSLVSSFLPAVANFIGARRIRLRAASAAFGFSIPTDQVSFCRRPETPLIARALESRCVVSDFTQAQEIS